MNKFQRFTQKTEYYPYVLLLVMSAMLVSKLGQQTHFLNLDTLMMIVAKVCKFVSVVLEEKIFVKVHKNLREVVKF